MKKILALAAILALSMCLLAGCGGSDNAASSSGSSGGGSQSSDASSASEELVTDGTGEKTFDFDGHAVKVEFDASGDYSAEFGENAVYVYAGDTDEEAVAFGVYLTPEEYDEKVSDAQGYDSYSEVGGGIMYTDDSGVTYYSFAVGDGVFYQIMVEPGNDADAIINLFTVAMA